MNDGQNYCVETLLYEVERLRKEVVAGAELHQVVLRQILDILDNQLQTVNPDACEYMDGILYAKEVVERFIEEERS